MPDPKVVHIGQDPSPDCLCGHSEEAHFSFEAGIHDCGCEKYNPWPNQVRSWIADHYANADLMASLKAEDDALDATFLDLLERWMVDAPDADCFEIGVDERIGTVRLRLARRDTKPAVDMGKFIQALLEAGVSPGVIGDAQQKALVEGKQGKPFPRFDRVKDDRDRERPKLEVVK